MNSYYNDTVPHQEGRGRRPLPPFVILMPAVEAGRSGVQGHSWLYSKVEASLGYMRLCLKTTQKRFLTGQGFASRHVLLSTAELGYVRKKLAEFQKIVIRSRMKE